MIQQLLRILDDWYIEYLNKRSLHVKITRSELLVYERENKDRIGDFERSVSS